MINHILYNVLMHELLIYIVLLVKDILYLLTNDHGYLLGAGNVNTRSVLLSIEAELKAISDIAWKEKLNATSAIRGNAQGGNKLRTYS